MNTPHPHPHPAALSNIIAFPEHLHLKAGTADKPAPRSLRKSRRLRDNLEAGNIQQLFPVHLEAAASLRDLVADACLILSKRSRGFDQRLAVMGISVRPSSA